MGERLKDIIFNVYNYVFLLDRMMWLYVVVFWIKDNFKLEMFFIYIYIICLKMWCWSLL